MGLALAASICQKQTMSDTSRWSVPSYCLYGTNYLQKQHTISPEERCYHYGFSCGQIRSGLPINCTGNGREAEKLRRLDLDTRAISQQLRSPRQQAMMGLVRLKYWTLSLYRPSSRVWSFKWLLFQCCRLVLFEVSLSKEYKKNWYLTCSAT